MSATPLRPEPFTGIDTLTIQVPVEPVPPECIPGPVHLDGSVVCFNSWIELPSGLNLRIRRDQTARVEMNVPKRLRGHNRTAATADEITDAVGLALDEIRAAGVVPTIDSLGEASVMRADFVRDFYGVSLAPEIIEALTLLRHKRRTKATATYGRDARPETLLLGPKSARAHSTYLYRKGTEDRLAPLDQVRFEARHRRKRFEAAEVKRIAHVETVADLTSESIDALAHAAFERARFGIPVVPRASILDHVSKAEVRKRELERLTLAGFMWFQSERRPLPKMCDSVRRHYTQAAQKIALTTDRVSRPVRLDWCSATMVPASVAPALSDAACSCEWAA